MRFFALTFATLFLLFSSGCGTSPNLETATKFQNAEQQFTEATEAADYIQVAAMYQEILDGGFESGSVLYNQGNAWMQAGKRGHAIASYRQAKQHLPRDPYLDANLKQALSPSVKTPRKPLLDYVFFWQHALSYREKGIVVTVLLAASLALLFVANLGWQRTILRRISYVLMGVLVLFAVSLGRDWFNFEWTKHGVIVVAESTARKGGSQSYEPAFNRPLTEGTEFTVLQQLDGWLNVQLGETGRCWIESNDCVTYPQ